MVPLAVLGIALALIGIGATVTGLPQEIGVIAWIVGGLLLVASALMWPPVRRRLPRLNLGRVDPVLSDIEHREGCRRKPARMETYFAQRPDGIQVKVAHCVDCGAMAYRHGDAPSDAAPAPRGDYKRSLSDLEGT